MTNDNNSEPSYSDIVKNLQNVIQNLENGATTIDTLSSELEQAYKWIDMLKMRLSDVEAKVERVIDTRTT